MVIRRKLPNKKRFPRRKMYKRKPRSRALARITSQVSGFPPAMVIKLKYCSTHIGLSSATAAFDYNTFNLNSLFDPDVTNIGHQPLLSDQLRALYARYHVYGCKVSVSGVCTSTNAIMTFGVGSTSHSLPNAVENASEQPLYTVRTVSNQKPVHYSKYYSMSRITGIGKSILADEDYSALLTANPAKLLQFSVGASSGDGGGTSGSVSIYVELVYHCRIYDPIDIAQS